MALKPDEISSNWQVCSASFTDTSATFCWIKWFKIDSITFNGHVFGKQSPKLTAIPSFGLNWLIKMQCWIYLLKKMNIDIYRGKNHVVLTIFLWFAIIKLDICSAFSPITSCPMQYCVAYGFSCRLIFKHCENSPNSYESAVETCDGTFPQLPITEQIRCKSWWYEFPQHAYYLRCKAQSNEFSKPFLITFISSEHTWLRFPFIRVDKLKSFCKNKSLLICSNWMELKSIWFECDLTSPKLLKKIINTKDNRFIKTPIISLILDTPKCFSDWINSNRLIATNSYRRLTNVGNCIRLHFHWKLQIWLWW